MNRLAALFRKLEDERKGNLLEGEILHHHAAELEDLETEAIPLGMLVLPDEAVIRQDSKETVNTDLGDGQPLDQLGHRKFNGVVAEAFQQLESFLKRFQRGGGLVLTFPLHQTIRRLTENGYRNYMMLYHILIQMARPRSALNRSTHDEPGEGKESVAF